MRFDFASARRAAKIRFVATALLLAGCGSLIGVEDSQVQGACTSNAECAPAYGCLLGACRNSCAQDADCGPGARCLKAIGASACIPATEGCGDGCPEGTSCLGGACRTRCLTGDDCSGGQDCQNGACVGQDAEHDPPTQGTGGNPPSVVGGPGGAGGVGGVGGVDGADSVGTGGAGGDNTGAGESQECTPSALFCAGNVVMQCATDGLSSEKQSTCAKSQYCDADTAACKDGVCAPNEPTCDGARATTCNAAGSGYLAGGKTCAQGTTCDAGDCVTQICTPNELTCKGQDVKKCAANGLSSSVVTTCVAQACVEDTGSASCKGECTPGPSSMQPCPGAKGNCAAGTQTCSGAGEWGKCSITAKPSDDCNVKGDDADCDGTPNTNCPCVTGDTQTCGPAKVGVCQPGISTCTNKVWGGCVGNVNKKTRDCTSALDNDCDGKADNTIDAVCACAIGSQACDKHPGYDGVGSCKAGSQTCNIAGNKASSSWSSCTPGVAPQASDTCDANNDASCDGIKNKDCTCINGATQGCGNCMGGTQACAAGQWGLCLGEPGAPVTYYGDKDHDTYGDKSGADTKVSCSGAPVDYTTNHTDCCDADAASFPGATNKPQSMICWYGANKCGSYDWNCDGASERIDLGVGKSCASNNFNGWMENTAPACGATGTYVSIVYGEEGPIGCQATTQYQCCR